MSCCNNKCNQGRDCPATPAQDNPWDFIDLLCTAAMRCLFFVALGMGLVAAMIFVGKHFN